MFVKHEANTPIMNWLYAGPVETDVSALYTDNYTVPFEPYMGYWKEASDSLPKENALTEGDTVNIIGKSVSWKKLEAHDADTQLTFARFGVNAVMLITYAATTIVVESERVYKLELCGTGAFELFVNGISVSSFSEIGRKNYQYTIDVNLKAGENIVRLVMLNVHLHCQNIFRLLLNTPCTTSLSLLEIPQRIRYDLWHCFSLSKSMLLHGDSLYIEYNKLSSDAYYQYNVFTSDNVIIAGGSIDQTNDKIKVLDYDKLPYSGTYHVKFGCKYNKLTIEGPELSFSKISVYKPPILDSLENRKEYLLKITACSSNKTNIRQHVFREIAKFATGNETLYDENCIFDTIDYINKRYDCSDFIMHGLLRFYFKYGHHPKVSDKARELMKRCILDFKYWVDEPGSSMMFTRSENHEILFYSAEYIAGTLFPAETFTNSGQNGLFHSLKGRINAEHWINEKTHFGFTEWHSNTYYEEDFLALLGIYDFGEENGLLRKLACGLMDLITLFIATNSSNGIMATTHGRCYEASLIEPLNEPMSRINWVLFGQPDRLADNVSIGAVALSDSKYVPDSNCLKMQSIIPLETRTRVGLFRRSDLNGVQCSTYRTEHYMVSGLIESRANCFGNQENAGQVLLENRLPVFVTCFSNSSPNTRPSYFGGQYIVPKTLAYRNILAYVFDIKTVAGFTHCYFPLEQFDEVIKKDRWLLARYKKAYIALLCSAPYEVPKSGPYRDKELLCHSKKVTWLIEMGEEGQYANFEAFVETITDSDILFSENGIEYTSPSCGRVQLSTISHFTVNGKSVFQPDAYMIQNEHVKSKYGSGIVEFDNDDVFNFFA